MKNTLIRKLLLIVLSTFLICSFSIGLSSINGESKAFAQDAVFEMIDGAEIRLVEPTGLRFRAKMSADYYANLTAENASDKLYIAIVPYAWYESYQNAEFDGVLCEYLTAQSKTFLNLEIPAEKIYAGDDGYYYANAVMSNVLFNNYNVPFVGVAYIQNGSAYEEVSAIDAENAMSVFAVAYKYYAEGVDLESEAYDEILEKAIYSAKGVKYDANAQKYLFDGQQYDSCAEICEAPSLENMVLTVENSKKVLKGENFALNANFVFSDGCAFLGDSKYVWESSNNAVATVDQNGNVTTLSDGTANITVSVLGGAYTATCAVEVYSYEGMNLASSQYFGSWVNSGITMEYVDADQAIKLTKLGANISGNHSHIEIAIMDEIRAAKLAGMKILTFEYYASGIYGAGANNPIIWIMANDGTASGVSSSYHIATPVDITAESEDKWVTAYIPLQDVYWLYVQNIDNVDLEYLMILVGGEQGGTISIRNIKFGDASAYEKYTYASKNFASPEIVGKTDANSIGLEYDTTENAMKITKLYPGLSGSHSHVRMPIMDEIRKAKALGLTKLTLEYKANEGDLLWIMCNDGSDSSVGSGCWLTSGITVDGTLAGEWNKVEIDLSNSLIDVETNEYLMFLSGGSETGGSIYIRNIKVS